jgi:hypothetical protein
MINVRVTALVDSLNYMGVNSAIISRTVRAVQMMSTDPIACPFHHDLEDQLVQVCEDCGMHRLGANTFDDLVNHASSFISTLHKVRDRYREHRLSDRADLVSDAAAGISRTVLYA